MFIFSPKLTKPHQTLGDNDFKPLPHFFSPVKTLKLAMGEINSQASAA